MRTVIQRAKGASVSISGVVNACFEGQGLVILLGIEASDTLDDVAWLVRKISNLRIFDDENGVMNRSMIDVDAQTNHQEGNIIVVSQFTLFASYKKGNRPSWLRAAGHEHAVPLYEAFLSQMEAALGKTIGHGEFGADMQVRLNNDGPVTIVMDTKNKE